jgi:hypothetical protein
MAYKESDEPADDNERTDIASELDLDFQEDQEFGSEDLPANEQKMLAKTPANSRFSLKARRAIEEHLEHRRLRKDIDYLFDDGFSEGNQDEKKK